MILRATDQKIVITTASGADIDFMFTYADLTTEATGGSSYGKITTATTTDGVAEPGASVERMITEALFANIEAATANTLTISLSVAGTLYRLWKSELLAGETLQYTKSEGFTRYTSDGERYITAPTITGGGGGGAAAWTDVTLADVATLAAADDTRYYVPPGVLSQNCDVDMSGITTRVMFVIEADPDSYYLFMSGEPVYRMGGYEEFTVLLSRSATTIEMIDETKLIQTA